MIHVHHVGARSGSHSFPLNKIFDSEIFLVMYDADENCIEQIEDELKQNNVKYKVINSGVGEKSENRTLYLNYDPNTSSFLKVNQKYSEYYYSSAGKYDYVVGDSYSVVKKCSVNVKPLDELCNEYNVSYPDVLSMDTQGTELEILKGAIKSLKNSVAVLTEVSFLPLYENQPLFNDVNEYLTDQGFIFCRFYGEHSDMSPIRAPIGARAKGLMVAADAIYLKNPDFIVEGNFSDKEKSRMLMNLSYIALVYGMFEYSMKCIRLVNYSDSSFQKNKIFCFMNSLYHEFESLTNYPEIFSDVYSVNESIGRFRSNKILTKPSRFKLFVKSSFLYDAILAYRKYRIVVKLFCSTLKNYFSVKIIKDSNIENLLIKHGMKELAINIKKSRLNL